MEFGRVFGDHYAGYVVEDSDLEYSDCSEADSSEDEGCTVNGSGRVSEKQDADLSGEDEFEKEMDSEAIATLRLMVSPTAAAQAAKSHVTRATPLAIDKPLTAKPSRALAKARQRRGSNEQQRKTVTFAADANTEDMDNGPRAAPNGPEPMTQSEEKTQEPEYYDDIYFDSSGSEDERGESEGIRKVGKKVRKMTNEELFYDPKMDEEDEKWMKRQRMTYLSAVHQRKKQTLTNQIDSSCGLPTSNSTKSAPLPSATSTVSSSSSSHSVQSSTATENYVLPKSDAVLNCPACMTTLCLDCQRHDIYTNQYRTMFVLNCCILRDEVLKYFPKPDKRSRKRNRGKQKRRREQAMAGGGERSVGGEGAELYHPVRCVQCNTEVAVYDKDEVYHFFNVLTSAPG